MIVLGLPTGGGPGTTRTSEGRLIVKGVSKQERQRRQAQKDLMSTVRAAHDPDANRPEIMVLAKHGEWEVRRAIAARPDCPHKLLVLLSDDEDRRVSNVAKYALAHPQKVQANYNPLISMPSWQDLVKLARSVYDGLNAANASMRGPG